MDLSQFFLINHRFLIDPSRHSVYDLDNQNETRLELRHMNLLVQLCHNRGKLVERDFLIRELWKDYGGASEALTQSISVLRNILADTKKELIKTIPKKGYIFQAEINAEEPSMVRDQPSIQFNTRSWLYGMLSGMAILALVFIFLRSANSRQKVETGNVGNKKFHYAPGPKPTQQKSTKAKRKRQ